MGKIIEFIDNKILFVGKSNKYKEKSINESFSLKLNFFFDLL